MLRLDVQNDGTGDVDVGHYDVVLTLPNRSGGWREVKARVEDFPRGLGAYELLLLAVKALDEADEGRRLW